MKTQLFFLLVLLAACTQVIEPSYNTTCVTEQVFETRGNSMAGIYTAGDDIVGLMNYTQCNNLTRYDHVLVNKAGNDAPILKRLMGVPGDHWHLNGSNIIVNDETLTTTLGEEYSLTSKGIRMLSLYTEDYPVIENGTYLILGNQPSGSFDAARFGLIGGEQIIGIVK
jgi:signal peptidase I